MAFSQLMASTQFYVFGRRHCTRHGWERHRRAYSRPDLLESKHLDLSEKVFMITGANSGIGKEVARFVASRQASVYMVCRSPTRAEEVKNEIIESTCNKNVHVLLADCGLKQDVHRCWSEFLSHREHVGPLRLDGLVCNAGALLNERTFTAEGIEVTFATHLLFGTYLLGSLALPLLGQTPDSRLVAVSSGGMYNTKFPRWDVATSTGEAKYNGQLAYAYAKRGQVLLMERWAKEYPAVKCVSCHPGWTTTPGVDAAYGSSQKFLEPLRTAWEGAEGIAWLCVVPAFNLQAGAFYLDRNPQTKHIAGLFMTEGSFTKNTVEQVSDMMRHLKEQAGLETNSAMQSIRARL